MKTRKFWFCNYRKAIFIISALSERTINAGNDACGKKQATCKYTYYQRRDLCPFCVYICVPLCSSSSWAMPLCNTCDGRVITMIDGAPKESIASMKENATYFIAINWPQLPDSGWCFSIWPASSHQELRWTRGMRAGRRTGASRLGCGVSVKRIW